MKKTLISVLVVVAIFSASTASAQTYMSGQYGTNYYYGSPNQLPYPSMQPYQGACIKTYSNLSFGLRGSEVRQLQTFLVSRNYPGGGNWMITGYFGRATEGAVKVFQQQQGLQITGWVDANTRAAIQRAGCGPSGQGYNYPTPYPNPIPCPLYQNNYNTPYAQGYGGTQYNNYNNWYNNSSYNYPCPTYGVQITSLSTYTGAPGTSVTVYGTGFDAVNNNVYFDGFTLPNIPSYNGTSITFTIPTLAANNNSVQVYVVNVRGTSNSMSFTVSNNGCSTYPYNNDNCCYNTGYYSGYNNNNCCYSGQYQYGSSGNYNNNCCQNTYGMAYQYNYNCCNNYNTGYNNNNCCGYSGGYNYNCGQAPTISSVNGPTSLSVGAQGTWTLTIHNPSNSYVTTSVNWGDTGYGYVNAAAPQSTYVQGTQTLSFTHTYNTAGTYTITFTVTNSSGQSNTSSQTIIVGGGYSTTVTLSSVVPSSSARGTVVTLNGSGFTANDNVVHFGIGGLRYVPSTNSGTQIMYTIPYFVSTCDLIGTGCAGPTQQVVNGPYQIYVTNGYGTSQSLTITVTN